MNQPNDVRTPGRDIATRQRLRKPRRYGAVIALALGFWAVRSCVAPVSPESAQAPTGVLTAEVSVDATDRIRDIPRTMYGQNLVWSWGGNMIWDFRSGDYNAELIRLTRELNLGLLRFPGGGLADFYHWRDGIGPQSSRKTTQHMPGDASSQHTFGTDEALTFAERTGTELLITVNAHNGTPQEAADWIRYVNKSPARGRGVRFWEVGNEFYLKGDGPENVAIPPQEYVKRLLAFVPVMRSADPSIKILAIGAENFGRYNTNNYPNWNREVLTRAGNEIDYLAVHNAYAPALWDDGGNLNARAVYGAMLAAPLLIRNNLETVSKQIETFAPSRAAHIKLAVTEWGPFFHALLTSKWIDHVKTLGSGLFVASTMKAFLESPRVEITNAFSLNELANLGWIRPRDKRHLTLKPADGQYVATGPYLALQMFTQHFGTVLVRSSSTSPTYASQAVGMVDAVRDVPYLEIVASRAADGKTLYVMGINKHFDSPIRAQIAVKGFKPDGTGTASTLRGTGIDAHPGGAPPEGTPQPRQIEAQPNPRFSRGGPGEVTITSTPMQNVTSSFEYTFPAHSVTSLQLRGF